MVMWPPIDPKNSYKMAASTQSVCQFWKDFDLQHLQVMSTFSLQNNVKWQQIITKNSFIIKIKQIIK